MKAVSNYLKKRILFIFLVFLVINIFSFQNSINIFADITSHFRLQYTFLSAFFFLLSLFLIFKFGKKFFSICFLSFVLLVCNTIDVKNVFDINPLTEASYAKKIKIGAFNVSAKNKNYKRLKSEIAADAPDILIFEEVDDDLVKNLDEIEKNYPYNIKEIRDDNFGIALYSKLPLTSPVVKYFGELQVPYIASSVNIDGIKLNLFCIHTLPPVNKIYFKERNQMLRFISTKAEKSIIAGDFNTTFYSMAYKNTIKKAGLFNAQVCERNLKGSFNALLPSFLRVPIDNILFSKEFCLVSFKYGAKIGSDHLPIFAEIGVRK